MHKRTVILAFLIACSGCASTNVFKQGTVVPEDFYIKETFQTAKSLVLLECELDGISKNFIFDTVAQLTAIQRDSIFGKVVSVRGGSNRTVDNGTETVKSLKIGNVDFVNTFANNGDMDGLKQQIPNFGGVLGRSVIDKANWLINNPQKTIEISNQELSDESFDDIDLLPSSHTPYTMVSIGGSEYQAIIDLGSTSIFNVPEDSELAAMLLKKYTFKPEQRDRYTVGGNETITELIGTIPLLKLGQSEFRNIRVNINKSSQIRLGMAFFANYSIYIDNTHHKYRIKRM